MRSTELVDFPTPPSSVLSLCVDSNLDSLGST